MDIKELIPKHKLDLETAEKLKDFSINEIKPIISDLMGWIQDMNWPVSRPVADYLISISEHLTTHILEILKGNDEMWKYWCIGVFGLYSAKPLNKEILKEIERIANNPTDWEKECEVDEQARKAIKSQSNKI